MDRSDQTSQPQSLNADFQSNVNDRKDHLQPLLQGIDYHDPEMTVPMLKSLIWDLGLPSPQKSREACIKRLDALRRYSLGMFNDCRKISFQGIGHDPKSLEGFTVASISQSRDEDGENIIIHLLDGLTAVVRPVQRKEAPQGETMFVTGLLETSVEVTGIPRLGEGRPIITQGFLGRRSSTNEERDETTVLCLRLGQRPRMVTIISFGVDYSSATLDVFLEVIPKNASINVAPSIYVDTKDVELSTDEQPSDAIRKGKISVDITKIASESNPVDIGDLDTSATLGATVDKIESPISIHDATNAMEIQTSSDDFSDTIEASTTTLGEPGNYDDFPATLFGDLYPLPPNSRSWTEDEWVIFDRMMELYRGTEALMSSGSPPAGSPPNSDQHSLPQPPEWTEDDQVLFDQIVRYHQESGIPMGFGLPPDFGAEGS